MMMLSTTCNKVNDPQDPKESYSLTDKFCFTISINHSRQNGVVNRPILPHRVSQCNLKWVTESASSANFWGKKSFISYDIGFSKSLTIGLQG